MELPIETRRQIKFVLMEVLKQAEGDEKRSSKRIEELNAQKSSRELEQEDFFGLISIPRKILYDAEVMEKLAQQALILLEKGEYAVCAKCGGPTIQREELLVELERPTGWRVVVLRAASCVPCGNGQKTVTKVGGIPMHLVHYGR